jgi:acetaldehyde dehydrogenase
MTVKAAIIGSGNIGTDLLFKAIRGNGSLEVLAMAGIDPDSDGLARARRLGIETTDQGVEGLEKAGVLGHIDVVFDATSAKAHEKNDLLLRQHPVRVVDLTPAAIGPYVVPSVNLAEAAAVRNVNMVTCGGQATIPVVAAVSRVVPVEYAEIVASISSRSAGPGTRANIDEFTETTSRAIEQVGGARRGKAIIVLNPADPPVIMRDTVLCLVTPGREDEIEASVLEMEAAVQSYVPGYRLKQRPQFEPFRLPGSHDGEALTKVTVFLEVEGAGHYLPPYAGNLDIMTAAAVRAGVFLGEGGRDRDAA